MADAFDVDGSYQMESQRMDARIRKVVLGAVLLAAAPIAQATAIPVTNAGFEGPTTTTFTNGVIDAWSISGTAGVFRPSAYQPIGSLSPNVGGGFIAGVIDNQTAYINSGVITQTLATALQIGDYTLKVNVGDRLDLVAPLYAIELLAGSTVLASVTQVDYAPPNDGWIEATLAFSSAVASSDLLGIRLSKTGGVQVNFDDVRLDFVRDGGNVPAPATLALLGLGLAGIGYRRRKQIKAA